MTAQFTVVTGTLLGIHARLVEVEVEVGPGLPTFAIVGLPDAAVQEARERVRSAIRSSGFEVPNARIVVNLAPGPLRKHGTGFDLPIAMGILGATGQLPHARLQSAYAVGELALDGRVRTVPGMLAHAIAAQHASLPLLSAIDGFVPPEGFDVRTLDRLSDLRTAAVQLHDRRSTGPAPETDSPDFADVSGQGLAVRALQIAAAGSLNVLLIGPPGTGKTMLARRLPSILPPLTPDEQLTTALVHSVAGLAPEHWGCLRRPFRAPHHTASIAGLVGGGSPPRPGEASLAHNGVLFLDELPEFSPAALQCLRQPMEDGEITIVRADGRMTFPSRFSLVAAANPCPCGYLGDRERPCRCPPAVVERYSARIGGPLMDRIDLVCRVDRPTTQSLLAGGGEASSRALAQRVKCARERASARSDIPISRLAGADLIAACSLESETRDLLSALATRHHLSGRSITRLLRVARTIADLEDHATVDCGSLAEAAAYRGENSR